MRLFFVPNWRFFAVLTWLAVFLLGVGFLFLFMLPAYAQVDPMDQAEIVVSQADLQPEMPPIDLSGLEGFLQSTEIIMGLLVFALTAMLRIVFKREFATTEGIYGVIILVFALLYMGAKYLGFSENLTRFVDVGRVLSQSIWAILAMLGVSSAAYLVLGTGLKNPLVARPQSNKWLSVGEPVQKLTVTLKEPNIQIHG